EVGYLAEEGHVAQLLCGTAAKSGPPAQSTHVSLGALRRAQEDVRAVRVTDEAISLMLKIRSSLRQEGITVSDRRFQHATSVIRAQAWLAGRYDVTPEDLEVLTHVLWHEPKDRRLVADRVLRYAAPDVAKALELRDLAAEQEKLALEKRSSSEQEAAEAMTKLKSLNESLLRLRDDVARQGRVPAKVERCLQDVQLMRRRVLREC